MTLSWDPDDERVVIEVFPYTEAAVVSPEQLDEELTEPEPDEVFLVRIDAGSARAFVKRAEQVLEAGRPTCPFCGNPIDPEGHLCVRANGFRRRDPERSVSRGRPPPELERRRARPPRPDHAGVQRHLPGPDRRGPRRLQADLGGAAAVGLPDGTLADREVAAYLVSEALGWDVVPPTLLRDGPHGPGMVQLWQEPDPEQEAVTLVEEGCGAARLEARLRRHRRPRPAGVARARGLRAAAPDGGLRRAWSTTPTARAATCWRWATATGTASTTASPSTSSTSSAPSCGAGSATRCPRTTWPRCSASARSCAGPLGDAAVGAPHRPGDRRRGHPLPPAVRAGRHAGPARVLPGDPVAAVLSGCPLGFRHACVVGSRGAPAPGARDRRWRSTTPRPGA